MRILSFFLIAGLLCGCGQKPKPELTPAEKAQKIMIVKYEAKTKALLDTNSKLNETRSTLDDQKRRLMVICTDHPDHEVCKPQTEAMYARRAFCEDAEFTGHVDAVVNACHQGECKQLDQAEMISRTQYMTLTQRLPHSLVTFGANKTKLDRRDKKQIQQFLEAINGEKGFVIVVGRASKDGNWRNNIRLALDRAEGTRKFLVESMGLDAKRVGFITYGHDKMYLTQLDAERLTKAKMSVKQANRSALIFSYPCYDGSNAAPF